MEKDMEFKRNRIEGYRKDVEPLFRYLPWLEEKQGKSVSTVYNQDGLDKHSVPFPVYDSTLLSFVKEVQRGSLTDRNYVYIYSRNHIRDVQDELRLIESVTIKNVELLTGILSKYVLGGMTKGFLWSQAVENGIFYHILIKFKELFEMCDQPACDMGRQE